MALNFQGSCEARDALEAAIKHYGHPAFIEDIDVSSSQNRRKILDATMTMCRDTMLYHIQRNMGESFITGYDPKAEEKADMNCPLVRALVAYGMNTQILAESVVASLRLWLESFGRPIVPKMMMLGEHEMRVLMWKREKEARKGKFEMMSVSNNVTKEKHHISNEFKWDELKQLSVRDLNLFNSNKGRCLEGKLIVDPYTPMVGCTSILEDMHGDVVLIALYNFLPDGASGSDANLIASTKIPKGSTVRIAEPFLKVFKDGSRGIRIDNPCEITVLMPDKKYDDSLEKYKECGNKLFSKNMYLAAIDSYLDGLRCASFVPTLLSNRSQAFIMMKKWGNALADAAASLTIRPSCKKTWSRYSKSMSRLNQDNEDEINISEMKKILTSTVFVCHGDEDINSDNEADKFILKMKGNDAFKNGDYLSAIKFYSSALTLAGKTCRALLSNWSQCCLNIGAPNDCIAGSFASLRIAFDEKAFYRLCKALILIAEPSISVALIDITSDLLKKNKKLMELSNAANIILSAIASGALRQFNVIHKIPPDFTPSWHKDIETFDAGKKGRGVRAKIDMDQGHVVLIEHPIAFAKTSGEKDNRMVLAIGDKRLTDASQKVICENIIQRCQREGLLSNIVDKLYDGITAKPLVSIDQLIPQISSTLFLLPSHHEFMKTEKNTLTSSQVQGIVSTNSHGNCDGTHKMSDRFSQLYPALSMFNHSKYPSCELRLSHEHAQVSILVTKRQVKAEEELTVSYHPDDETAKANWEFE